MNSGELTWIHKDEKVMAPPFQHSLPPCASHPILFRKFCTPPRRWRKGDIIQGAHYPEISSIVLTLCVNPVPCIFICRSNSNMGFPWVFLQYPIIRDLWSSIVFCQDVMQTSEFFRGKLKRSLPENSSCKHFQVKKI